ncbi:hypothetical protein C5L29_001204 [Lactiplantibacillus pentosus]|nr:hypothetical protein C5L29_001204 [Lactiplantibacillus pentosus]
MILKVMKAIGFFLANWLSVILFIAGLTFLDLEPLMSISLLAFWWPVLP